MAQTEAFVRARLPRDLAGIVLGYFCCDEWGPRALAIAGEYELCASAVARGEGENIFYGACKAGHLEIIRLALPKVAECDLRFGLHEACGGGQVEAATWLLSLGVDDVEGGLAAACEDRQPELVALMIAHGAGQCAFCGRSVAGHIANGAQKMKRPAHRQNPLSGI